MRRPRRRARKARGGGAPRALGKAGGIALIVASITLPISAQISRAELDQRAAILAIEDARPPDAALAPILQVARGGVPDLQAVAIRALGRLERPGLVPHILPALASPFSSVRLEGANALAQALSHLDQTGDLAVIAPAREALIARLNAEADPKVRGGLFQALGRLPLTTADDVRRVEGLLLTGASVVLAGSGTAADTTPQILGAVKGLESLIRLRRKVAPPGDRTLDQLRRLARTPLPAHPPLAGVPGDDAMRRLARDRARIQRLALTALLGADAVDPTTISNAWRASDLEVRRLALVAAGRLDDFPERRKMLEQALEFEKDVVLRYEGLRSYARQRGRDGCRPIRRLAGGGHEGLVAIDLLGDGCPDAEKSDIVQALESLVGRLTSNLDAPWHEPAHALVALAKIEAGAARERIEYFIAHPTWQVRMYAAHAAAILRDGDRLAPLARDDHDNVREAAIQGLARMRGHDADAIVIEQLERRDYQLVGTAATLLKGSPRGESVLAASIDALKRITAERRDTSRDPRLALLERIAEFGSASESPAVAEYLRDFDPRIAAEAARLLSAWNGVEYRPDPTPPRAAPLPDGRELEALRLARVTLWVAPDGGRPVPVGLRLFPLEAPATCARFVRLARAGAYNGLTFHRVVPAFVIQGGSPGANEYAGHDPYARDELGLLPHVRGAVGISTRGRDTGDMQIFVDLVDNPRLDHNYTVFAEVDDADLRAIDAVLEGATIERVEIASGAI